MTSGPRSDDPRGDLRWGTTGGLLAAAAGRWPQAEAIVDGDLRLSYSELDAEVTAAAQRFPRGWPGPG